MKDCQAKNSFTALQKTEELLVGKKSDCPIRFEDYLSCEKIWDVFGMKNMGHFHDRCLKKDVLFLTDVFEKFIDTCFKFYGLEPCHYFSSPGLSWDAILKVAGVKLEKISDTSKDFFIEKGLNGGISYIAKRYVKANNEYMKDYDPTKPSKFINYLYMYNLYGWGLSEYLPYGGFKWLKNVDGFDVMSISKKNPTGYILEGDLQYPNELHE